MEEWIWRKIIEKMYDPTDAQILEKRFIDAIARRKIKN
jgi:hypothetical protein